MAEQDQARSGVTVIRGVALSSSTAQTTGMRRDTAVAPETTGGSGFWMGRATTAAGHSGGWHHHGDCETGIYVVSGRARFSWGPGGKQSAEVGPGDFLAVAPNAIHREECLGDEDLVLVVARACSGVLVVNTDGPEADQDNA